MLRLEENGHNFADGILKCIYFSEKVWILITDKISLEFLHEGLIDNKSALVQAMAWHQSGGKLLSEPVLTRIYDAIWSN